MTYTNTQTEAGNQTEKKTLQANEIKNLIQRQGKATFGNTEFVLKSPTANDPKLQEIINDPAFSVTSSCELSKNGDCEYELKANGKSLKIKVECKKTS